MAYRSYHNQCDRCRCPLDAGEGRLCETCIAELEEEEEQGKEIYGMPERIPDWRYRTQRRAKVR